MKYPGKVTANGSGAMRPLSRSANIAAPPSPRKGVMSIARSAGSRIPSSIAARCPKLQSKRPTRPRAPVYVDAGPIQRLAKDESQPGHTQFIRGEQLHAK